MAIRFRACRRRGGVPPVLLAAILAAALLGACAEPPPPVGGPIVLVTASGVRADVASPGRTPPWMPRLGELAASADWTGTAIAASSDPLVSLVSLHLGTSPWQHQLLSADAPRRRDLPTLAEALREAGYRGRAYVPDYLHDLLGAGFDEVGPPLGRETLAAALGGLADGDFLWLHFPTAELTYGRRKADDGTRLTRRRLLTWADPGVPLPEEEEKLLWRAYGQGVFRLDRQLGDLLRALEASPAWPRTLLVFTSSHGTELGEHGQVLHGENLGRTVIEVPLVVKLPAGAPPLAEPPGRVAQVRLWSTIAELAGVRPAPVHPPSLAHRDPAPILSELYERNGVNLFSLVEGDLQLTWTARFAPPAEDYWTAQRWRAGARSGAPPAEPPARLFARLEAAFEETPPLSGEATPGEAAPVLALARFTADGVLPLDDPATARRLALRLRRQWMRFVDRERTPRGEERRAAVVP